MPLDATPGGASANSYLTRAEANTYFSEVRLHDSVWTAASDADKDSALMWATQTIDAVIEFAGRYRLDSAGDITFDIYPLSQGFGRRTTKTQRLEWPRSGLIARNRLELLSDSIVPEEIKNATAELALQLLSTDRTLDSDIESQGLTSLSVGSISMDFREGVVAKVVPDIVRNLIPAWWIVGQKDRKATFAMTLRY